MAQLDKLSEGEQSLQIYRIRQQDFAIKCGKDHKMNNGTWVLMTDTDEFLTKKSAISG